MHASLIHCGCCSLLLWLLLPPLLPAFCFQGTPAQRKKIVLASVTGVLGSLYVVAMCVFMARSGAGSPLSMLYKL